MTRISPWQRFRERERMAHVPFSGVVRLSPWQRMKRLGVALPLLLVCSALAAPPVLPAPKRVAKKPVRLTHTAGSKTGALQRAPYLAAPLVTVTWLWSYTFTPPQKTFFRFYGRNSLSAPWTLLGTNTVPHYTQTVGSGMQFIGCVAVDRDMVTDSSGRPR